MLINHASMAATGAGAGIGTQVSSHLRTSAMDRRLGAEPRPRSSTRNSVPAMGVMVNAF